MYILELSNIIRFVIITSQVSIILLYVYVKEMYNCYTSDRYYFIACICACERDV
jgi:hypothetical protein